MKLLSEACEYGLRAVVWLAQRPRGAYKVKEIAEATKAAPGYLVKVLQELAKAGILTARRGSQGGYTLHRDPESLTVLEVISAVDPIERIRTCPLGLEAHGTQLCLLHRRIDDAMGMMEESFGKTTIQEIVSSPAEAHPLCRVP